LILEISLVFILLVTKQSLKTEKENYVTITNFRRAISSKKVLFQGVILFAILYFSGFADFFASLFFSFLSN
jgi:ABC-type microcin C transport system permease subunit YejB